MIALLQKSWPIIAIALLLALVISLLFFPELSSWISITLLVSSLGMAFFFILQRHLQPYQQGLLTRTKFARNVLLDILGLLLTLALASYFASLAGMRLGAFYGIWVGLIAGMIVAFLAAWLARKAWGSLARLITNS